MVLTSDGCNYATHKETVGLPPLYQRGSPDPLSSERVWLSAAIVAPGTQMPIRDMKKASLTKTLRNRADETQSR